MTRNFKKLGLALLAVFALAAIGAQGAGAVTHKFHSDGPRTIITGVNVGADSFTVGAAGTVQCNKATFQGTVDESTEVSAGTYASSTITVVPKYEECTFGGQPATVNFHHCAYVYEGNTTLGNPTGNEHASTLLECAGAENKVTIHTVNCTITIGPQTVPDSLRFENEINVPSAFRVFETAHNIVVGKERSTASQPVNGCLTFPTGAIGKHTTNVTNKCFSDGRESPLSGTEKTTPPSTGLGGTTDCTMAGAPSV